MPLNKMMLDRRHMLGLTGAAMTALGLSACSTDDSSTSSSSESGAATVELDATAYDSLVASGTVADDATIQASQWASAIKSAGVLRVGTTRTSTLFSQLNEQDNKVRGFDAGIFQLLTRYILGDESKNEISNVTSDTRESVLQNNQVDTVFATYSITDARKEVISFAGPYMVAKQGALLSASNTTINTLDDLADKAIAVQSSSTGPSVVSEYFPNATQQAFSTDEEARQALEQGRVDAYVIDTTIEMGAMAKNPGKYRMLDETFGSDDPYGIGLPKDSDGVAFVNAFLQQIEDAGLWAALWEICIGAPTGISEVPTPPTIGA